MIVLGDFLSGLGGWSDEYEVRAFDFRKMCEAAGTARPSSMNNLVVC